MKQFLFLTLFLFLAFDSVFIKEAMGQTTYQEVILTFHWNSQGDNWVSRLEPVFSFCPDFATTANEILDSLTGLTHDQDVLALRDALKKLPEVTDFLPNSIQTAFNNWEQNGCNVIPATESYLNNKYETLRRIYVNFKTEFENAIINVRLKAQNYSRNFNEVKSRLQVAKKAVDRYSLRRDKWVYFLMGLESSL
ncbi:uncharacterized protein LOC116339957 [Contarinia nasturtii]|uniref:uncharacterized protein LOC116339956 n=1 Tax=Contarinia nasturtii TaxID=265458 RepID=UPI0012D3B4B6|nr:uncharacterized protein LOC116339956 [Contarinia nasturtii]XP_031621907.1 uncharacterized protein LOC116339957 [Contarinia nasturtii]